MKIYLILTLLVAAILAQAPSPQNQLHETLATGDSPLSLFDSQQGRFGYKVLPTPYDSAKVIADSFSLDTLPAGATLTRLWYVVTDWRLDSSLVTTKIGADSLPCDTIFYDISKGKVLSTFVYDLTSKVTNQGLVTQVSNLKNSYLSFFYLIYEDASLPKAQIDLYLGSEALQNDSSSVTIESAQAWQGVRVAVLTEAADGTNSDNENIFLNGVPIAQPGLFFGNLGPYADYYTVDSLTVYAGTNHLTIMTGQDYFGYHALIYSHHFETVSALDKTGPELLKSFDLLPNYPNPFNPSTEIRYRLKRPSFVSLDVFDITGNHVRTFALGKQSSGLQRFVFSASGLAGGIYFYRITANGLQKTRKMILLK